jgi:Uma2 family endonuclease
MLQLENVLTGADVDALVALFGQGRQVAFQPGQMIISPIANMEEFQALREHFDEHVPVELFDGEMIVISRPAIKHAAYAMNIGATLFQYLAAQKVAGTLLAEVEVALSNARIVIADLLYLAEGSSLGQLTDKQIKGACEWVCEIASPSTRKLDEERKFAAYQEAGILEYWQVDPDRAPGQRFRCYVLDQGSYRLLPSPAVSTLFPGISLPEHLL